MLNYKLGVAKVKGIDRARGVSPHLADQQVQECWDSAEAEVRKDLKDKKIRKSIMAVAHKFEKWLLEKKA
jgi:hypothetical protein